MSDAVRVLVINSFTARSISGKQLVDYTRNRFAYSMAMEIARQEAIRAGIPAARASRLETLADFSPLRLSDLGGAHFLYTLLRHIPEEMTISDLRDRYVLHDLDAVYDRYFGSVANSLLPDTFNIRGPLLFGIAESERARIFCDCLEAEDWTACGKLMSVGHDGDRRTALGGGNYRYDVGDASLGRLSAGNIPVEYCPGAYGASTPALDALVDTALLAGAFGALLTIKLWSGRIGHLARRICGRGNDSRPDSFDN